MGVKEIQVASLTLLLRTTLKAELSGSLCSSFKENMCTVIWSYCFHSF